MIMNETQVDGKLILISLESWAQIEAQAIEGCRKEGLCLSGQNVLDSFNRFLTRLNRTYLGRDRAYDPCWERKPE